jgi:hypothetical protein
MIDAMERKEPIRVGFERCQRCEAEITEVRVKFFEKDFETSIER